MKILSRNSKMRSEFENKDIKSPYFMQVINGMLQQYDDGRVEEA